MTNDEKAKAYDEALEQAKKELQTCGSIDCDAARQIFRFFPKLAESEDERVIELIRKLIINARDVQSNSSLWEQYNAALAWLEKQKEEEGYDAIPIESTLEYKAGKHAGFLEGLNEGRKQKESLRDFIDDFPYSDEQKEQKPIPKFKVSDIIKYRGETYEITEVETTTNGPYYSIRLIGNPSDWEEVKTGIGPGGEKDMVKVEQKPADLFEMMVHKEPYIAPVPTPMVADEQKLSWSEEDEEMLNIALQCLVGTPYSQGTKDKVFHWLKSLKNRGNSLKSNTNSPNEQYTLADLEAEWKHGYDYAKKEMWKPSEEHMEAFKKYIEEFQARAEAAVGGWNNFDVMIRLYEQLKKL